MFVVADRGRLRGVSKIFDLLPVIREIIEVLSNLYFVINVFSCNPQ